MVTFDSMHVFRVFGGPNGLLAALDKHQPGHGFVYPTVQQWHARHRIPATAMGAVLYCIYKEGHPIIEFLHDPDEMGDTA